MRFYRSDELDLEPSPEPPPRDDRLRGLVDHLPATLRHMVERVHFGDAPVAEAAAELGLPRWVGGHRLEAGLAQLRTWLEEGFEPPADRITPPGQPRAPHPRMVRCSKRTRWGRCQQPEVGAGLCLAHLRWMGQAVTPDPAYERKIVEGLLTPAEEHLSKSELNALLNGRYRGDGRRLDIYVVDPPTGMAFEDDE